MKADVCWCAGSQWYVERLVKKYPHLVKMFSVHLYGILRGANDTEVMIFPGTICSCD